MRTPPNEYQLIPVTLYIPRKDEHRLRELARSIAAESWTNYDSMVIQLTSAQRANRQRVAAFRARKKAQLQK